jgi:hypothetical protein
MARQDAALLSGSAAHREVLTELELVEAEAELKALQRHALEIVHPAPE